MRDNFTVALYIRLSVEDENDGESNSVKNQRDLLTAFVKKNTEFSSCTLLEFCDDGYSGVNFNRPGVTKMLEKVRSGKINCIIVKDFSRFGRNYIEVGDYLEQVFPFLDVRFISLNDNYDSSKNSTSLGGIEVALRTLIYDLYSKDLSQKCRSGITSRWKKGEFISTYAPYGYKKTADNRHRIEIDEEAATVVRRIFEMAMSGKTVFEIAKALNADKIPTRGQYKRLNDCTRNWDSVSADAEKAFWTDGAVWKIIRDERYLGMSVFGKSTRVEVGDPKAKFLPKSQWLRVSDTHEPLVTKEEFELANKMAHSPRKPPSVRKERILYDKVRCCNCNHALIRYSKIKPVYFCETPRFIPSPKCVTELVSEILIEEALLSAIRIQAKSVVNIDKARVKKNKQIIAQKVELEKAIRRYEGGIKKLMNDIQGHYEKLKDEVIGKEQYFTLKDDCNRQIDELEAKIVETKAIIASGEAQISDMAVVTEEWHKALNIERLSKSLVDTLVDSIIIYDSEHIEIRWRFADEYLVV